ncbi:MAG: hypothetical protein D6722_10640 [Bacteroidetes bacterium]|nr:MAG: hypothetical protein D6722_10640 [Bacteroidota bacterium]
MFRTFLLSLLMALPAVLPAQSESEQVKAAIEDGLRTYVSDLYPPKGCPENASSHSYAGTYKITKHGSVNGTLRVFGVAKVTYRNARTGGADTIEFYAELEKENGQVVLSRLRWRRGPCMQYATLMGES